MQPRRDLPLSQARGLELAVPGTYRADREVVAIASFAPSIKVMNSKQRPRRLAVFGSDGQEYALDAASPHRRYTPLP